MQDIGPYRFGSVSPYVRPFFYQSIFAGLAS